VHLDRTRILPGAGAQQTDRVVEPALLRAQETKIVQAIEIGCVDVEDGAVQRRGLAQLPVPVKRDRRMVVPRGVGAASRQCRAESLVPGGAPAPSVRPAFVQIANRQVGNGRVKYGHVENGHGDCSPFFCDRALQGDLSISLVRG